MKRENNFANGIWELQCVRYYEFCALSSDRFARKTPYALIPQSRWTWKQPSVATKLIRVIVTQGKGESLRGIHNLGNSWRILAQFTVYVCNCLPIENLWKSYLDKASETKVPHRPLPGPVHPNTQYNWYLVAPWSHSHSLDMHVQMILLAVVLTLLLFPTHVRQQRNQGRINTGP